MFKMIVVSILRGLTIGLLLLTIQLISQNAHAAEYSETELRRETLIQGAINHLPPYLLEAVCEQESRFRLKQVSNKGAIGVCQILPSTVALVAGGDPYADSGPKTYRVGAKGAVVERIQAAVGIYVDGRYGPITRAAVIEFQSWNDLVEDGIVGWRTWRALFDGERLPGVTISDALRHPPTNIMWAATVLSWCRDYLQRDEPGVMLACYYSGASGQVTRYLREVFERMDNLFRVSYTYTSS